MDKSSTKWVPDLDSLRHAIEIYKRIGLFENIETAHVVNEYVSLIQSRMQGHIQDVCPNRYWQNIDIAQLSQTRAWWTDPDDCNDTCIMCLTPNEKAMLWQELKFPFHDSGWETYVSQLIAE